MIRILIFTLAAAAFVTACAARPTGAQPDPLADTSWLLDTLGGQPPASETAITLNFGAGGALDGSDGCNSYSTTYTVDGASLTISQPIATTERACPAPVMEQASAYLQALGTAANYSVDGQKLSLSDSEGANLATFSAQSRDLAGTSWNVVAYNNGQQAVVSVMADTPLTANFGRAADLTGFAGCNDYNATYTVSGTDGLVFGPIATTRKACEQPEGVMDQEAQYLAALATVATYAIDGTQLEMRTSDGALAATFQRAAP